MNRKSIFVILMMLGIVLAAVAFIVVGCGGPQQVKSQCEQAAADINEAEVIVAIATVFGDLSEEQMQTLRDLDVQAWNCYADLCSDPNHPNIINDANCIAGFVKIAKQHQHKKK